TAGSAASRAAGGARARPGGRPWWPVESRWPWLRAPQLLPGVIARAHQRAGLDVTVPHLEPQAPQLGELRGRVVAGDGAVLRGRTQVLADGEDVDPTTLRAQVAHGAEQLVPLLAETAHDPRLGEQLGVQLLGATQQLERPRVAAAGPRQAVQPLDRLEVVVQDVGARGDHALER